MVEDEEEKEEQGKTEIIDESSRGSTEWERIHHTPKLPLDSLNNSKGWSMMAIGDFSLFDQKNRIVFPPIDHENLHNSTTSTESDHDDRQTFTFSSSSPSPSSSRSSSSDVDCVEPLSPLPSPRPRPVLEESRRWWDLWLEILRFRVYDRCASSFRKVASVGWVIWSFLSPAGSAAVGAVMLVLYLRLRRKRRLGEQKRSMDRLIRVIGGQDEKINHLLDQMARMNEVLIALHRGRTTSRTS